MEDCWGALESEAKKVAEEKTEDFVKFFPNVSEFQQAILKDAFKNVFLKGGNAGMQQALEILR